MVTVLSEAWRLATSGRSGVHLAAIRSGVDSTVEAVGAELGIGLAVGVQRQTIHRGTFENVGEPSRAIRAFITGWSERCHPFVWKKLPTKSLPNATVNQLETTGPPERCTL